MSDGLSASPSTCRQCSKGVRADARFCDGCGARLAPEGGRAEYKQVTVLFADVVHSMDLAAAVGAERLREIMAELFDRASAMVRRFGGTVDKFTGDGLMAVFGAPVALEDHAFRACLAALALHEETQGLEIEVQRRDGVDLRLRVGLNSGEVIAGEIGSGAATYTTVGEQVGFAQRMESAAPPGGVMVSASTARLVDGHAVLGEPEHVRIKGATEPVVARRLLAAEGGHGTRQLATLIGRQWELSTIVGALDQAVNGMGRVVGLVGPPGIGKSRLGWEVASMAAERGIEVFTASCESHTSELPFYVATCLLRNIFAMGLGTPGDVRATLRTRMPEADPEDLVLLDDLLGIRDDETPLPVIDPDARRRRLTVLLNTAAAARPTPAVYVIEDVHWIDEVSEAMLADVAAVMPQTRSLMLVTYRPEYGGALDRLPGAHRIALAPLDDSESTALAADLLGGHSSVAGLVATIADRAAGNPFFAEEIIRDLAERRVLIGEPGAYTALADTAEVRVPATLQATIAARIDRLGAQAKRTLNAAAVIGAQFDSDLLTELVTDCDLSELITAELVDQVTFTRPARYAFRHPMIRTVTYESQLKADRVHLHRALAALIDRRDPQTADEHAALIAQHLEAAGDLHEAYQWHMRAGSWAQFRDVRAARTSWQRARDVADRLNVDDRNKTAMQIAPRTALCGSTFRASGSIDDAGFEELQDLCASNADRLSLAFGMAGMVTALLFHNRFRDAVRVASECSTLAESIADQWLTISPFVAASNAMIQAGETSEGLRLAQRAIELADGDFTLDSTIVGSPLAVAHGLSGVGRLALGLPGWRDDLDRAATVAKTVDLTSHVAGVLLKYGWAAHVGAVPLDKAVLIETAEALNAAERSGDDFSLDSARLTHGLVLLSTDESHRSAGLALINQYRDASFRHGYATKTVRWVDIVNATETARLGDVDGGIDAARVAVKYLYATGDMVTLGQAVVVFVELLLQRRELRDLTEATAAIERLAAVPVDPGFVLHELPLRRLRALLAGARGDEAAYLDYRDSYRTMANALGFEGHIAIAEAMT